MKIYRYEVPVDDQWHTIALLAVSGKVLHVASRVPDVVEFWAIHTTGTQVDRDLRVFGTGQELPDEQMWHVGTALIGRLVWHLWMRNHKE